MPNKSLIKHFDRILINAREEALKDLTDYALRTLPKGWTLYLMVGWGVSVGDDKGKQIFPTSFASEEFEGISKPLQKLIETADYFEEHFGVANERITNG